MDARGLKSEVMIPGVQKSAIEDLADWTFWADKVVVF
jgi:sulfur relay (sulfurtransferase) complex TusBCD TusD component (DsrE family)